MLQLSEELAQAGWNLKEVDNWRDCGWSMVCHRAPSELQVILSLIEDKNWLLQISPNRLSGLVGRLFSVKPLANSRDVYDLALAVHGILSALQYLGNPRWRWDGFPYDTDSTPTPTPG